MHETLAGNGSAADNLAALKGQTDARGRSFEVIPIPEAYDVEATSEIFARSYINFALANGGVVMPTFGRPSSDEARAAVARAFPDRRIVTVDVGAVVPAGGGDPLHHAGTAAVNMPRLPDRDPIRNAERR